MNVRTIIYVAAAVMAVSCGNNNSKTAEQPQATEVRLPNVTIMAASYKDVPQSDVYTANVEAYAKNNIAPQSPSRIQKIFVEVGDFVRAGQIVAKMDEVSNPMVACAVACAIAAVISQIGDLAASAIKRNHNVKDYGNLIPGHGGVLDRFDSMIFTAPAIYFALTFLR